MNNKLIYKNNPNKPLCAHCRLYLDICICDFIKKNSIKNKITLFMHVKEYGRLTNTGNLLTLCLDNISVVVKGRIGEVFSANDLIKPNHNNLILHPTGSRILSKNDSSNKYPINLIIPDGTWSQSNKMLNSETILHSIPRVRLPLIRESDYVLRKESHFERISTFEAAARALGILEDQEIEIEMLKLFKIFVNKLLKRSGRL